MQPSSSCRVLVVDDDVPTSFLTRRRLEAFGFRVSCALNGEDAMLLLETRQFDALIVDYQLASQNGVDFYRLAVGQGIVLPTIMVTGIEDPDLEIYALDAGMQAFIRKSITYLESLPDILTDVIDGRINRASRPARAGYWECTTALLD
jgi:DNA-binding response OmpR family regulator